MTVLRHIFKAFICLGFILKANTQTLKNDTTFLVREVSKGFYHAIYIDTNGHSKYYKYLTNFNFEMDDSLSYYESILAIENESERKFFHHSVLNKLPKNWCQLNPYKGQLYLYAPSDWGNNPNIILNDSCIIAYFMDGPYAYLIDSVNQLNPNTFELIVHSAYRNNTKITIYMLDWVQQMAIFDYHLPSEERRYALMVGADKAKTFPLIVNFCENRKTREFIFEPYNFDQLMKLYAANRKH